MCASWKQLFATMFVAALTVMMAAAQGMQATKVYDSMKGRVANAHAVCAALGGDERPTVEFAREDGTSVHCKVRFKDGRINEQHTGSVSWECPNNWRLADGNACTCDAEDCRGPVPASPQQNVTPGTAAPAAADKPALPKDCAGRRGTSPGKQPGTPADAKAPRMPEHRVQCFSTAKRQDPAVLKQFAAQLRGQQEGLNRMTVGEFIGGMNWYAEKRQDGSKGPRKGEEAKQKAMREKYEKAIKASIVKTQECRGLSKRAAEKKADEALPRIMKDLAALHEPDIAVAGSEVTRLGHSSVNSSIGAQWAQGPGGRFSSDDSRRYRLLSAAMKAQSAMGDEALLNVVLEPCRQ